MRERDLERAEVARMAAQADEATRAAQEMKLQLDRVSTHLLYSFSDNNVFHSGFAECGAYGNFFACIDF